MWILASMIGSTCVTLLCEDEDMGRIGRDRVRKEERSKEDSGGRKMEKKKEKEDRNRENKHNARQSRNEDQYTSTEQNELDAGTSKS